jgi:hypothetical protein
MIDNFNWFCLSNRDKEFLKPYRSSPGETSLFKDIPIQCLDQTKVLMRQLGIRARIVYRGPRGRYRDQAMTWKRDANRFAVYTR